VRNSGIPELAGQASGELECQHLDAGPIARVKMPYRVVGQVHGFWVPGEQLRTERNEILRPHRSPTTSNSPKTTSSRVSDSLSQLAAP
jgi:hypothetical protein